MFRQSAYILGSLGLAVGLLSFITGVQMQSATARTGAAPAAVNRALKGDRLPLMPGASSVPHRGTVQPALPEGCVASHSAARSVFSAEVPGRCVAGLFRIAPVLG